MSAYDMTVGGYGLSPGGYGGYGNQMFVDNGSPMSSGQAMGMADYRRNHPQQQSNPYAGYGVLGDLYGQYQSAFNQAKASNLNRYNQEIGQQNRLRQRVMGTNGQGQKLYIDPKTGLPTTDSGINPNRYDVQHPGLTPPNAFGAPGTMTPYGQVPTGQPQPTNKAYGYLDQLNNQGLQDIATQAQSERARNLQQLTNSGLANSTMLGTLNQATALNAGQADRRWMNDMMGLRMGQDQALTQGKIGVIDARKDSYPDYNQLASLAQAIGQGNTSGLYGGGGGGGYSGGAAAAYGYGVPSAAYGGSDQGTSYSDYNYGGRYSGNSLAAFKAQRAKQQAGQESGIEQRLANNDLPPEMQYNLAIDKTWGAYMSRLAKWRHQNGMTNVPSSMIGSEAWNGSQYSWGA